MADSLARAAAAARPGGPGGTALTLAAAVGTVVVLTRLPGRRPG